MTSQHRSRLGLAAALAVVSLATAAPAGADPNPAQRVESSARAQEQYYMSHKPAIPAPGHEFNVINARETTDVTATEPSGSSGFEWDDAAIGAGSALGIALVFAGGAVAMSRRQRGSTGGAATS